MRITLESVEDKDPELVAVNVNGQSFTGNTTETLLEQAENNGLPIMNSCRTGICGACMVQLEFGEVTQSDAPALLDVDKKAGRILACCSVPKTDIKISV